MARQLPTHIFNDFIREEFDSTANETLSCVVTRTFFLLGRGGMSEIRCVLQLFVFLS